MISLTDPSPILAQLDKIPSGGGTLSRASVWTLSDILLLVGAALAITGGFVLWAIFIRKRPREGYVYPKVGEEGDDPEPNDGRVRKRKRKSRRRQHRVRKPTLAETGGLPPAKQDQT